MDGSSVIRPQKYVKHIVLLVSNLNEIHHNHVKNPKSQLNVFSGVIIIISLPTEMTRRNKIDFLISLLKRFPIAAPTR